ETAFVKLHRTGFRVGFRILQEFLCEYAKDRWCADSWLRPRVAWMNLPKPQGPAVLILSVLSILPILSPSEFDNAETLLRAVRISDRPSKVVPVRFPPCRSSDASLIHCTAACRSTWSTLITRSIDDNVRASQTKHITQLRRSWIPTDGVRSPCL